MSSIAAIMDEIKGLAFKNKKAAAFGAYGWSGESVKVINGMLGEAGFSLVNEGLRELWYPGDEAIANCQAFGKEFAKAVK